VTRLMAQLTEFYRPSTLLSSYGQHRVSHTHLYAICLTQHWLSSRLD